MCYSLVYTRRGSALRDLKKGDDMPALEQRSILIKSGELASDGLLHSQVFTPQERLQRALKMWGLLWLLALASVPIIVAHWVLVPGFFLAGPIWAYKRYRTPSVPDHVSGRCPMKSEEISVALEASDRLPMWTHCPVCNASLQFVEREQSTVS